MSLVKTDAAFSGYAYDKPRVDWSTREEVTSRFEKVTFDPKMHFKAGGVPVISDGKTGCVDASDGHTCVIGASGFKKTLTLFMPLICSLIQANESMVITDPKGEIYKRMANTIRAEGYNMVCIDLRRFEGDCYNPFHLLTKMYKEGKKDEALVALADMISALAAPQYKSNIDTFWPDTAQAYLNGVGWLMLEHYDDAEEINVMSLASYNVNENVTMLDIYTSESEIRNAAMTNMRTVLSEPDRTRMSTISTASSMLQPFIKNDKLARMMCHQTFSFEDLTDKKTAFFIVTDDSTETCNTIVGMLITQIMTFLVDRAFASPDGKLSRRVNFVLDEFCSFPITNIDMALATHRSRGIRYYLCIQSLAALKKRYESYQGMLTNCSTTVFLGTTEPEALEYVSGRFGTTSITATGTEEPLVTAQELMTLKKSWYEKEALYLNLAENIRYFTTLPSIECYKAFNRMPEAKLPSRNTPPYKMLDFKGYVDRVLSSGRSDPLVTEKAVRRTRRSPFGI